MFWKNKKSTTINTEKVEFILPPIDFSPTGEIDWNLVHQVCVDTFSDWEKSINAITLIQPGNHYDWHLRCPEVLGKDGVINLSTDTEDDIIKLKNGFNPNGEYNVSGFQENPHEWLLQRSIHFTFDNNWIVTGANIIPEKHYDFKNLKIYDTSPITNQETFNIAMLMWATHEFEEYNRLHGRTTPKLIYVH